MKLKLDAEGHVVLKDGLPVYVHDDGQEIAHDAAATIAKITQLNGEARDHRIAKEKALDQLKVFEGIDPEAARKALETVKNLDEKRLIDAGEVQRIKDEAKAAYDAQLRAEQEKQKPIIEENTTLKGQIKSLRIGYAFSGSQFITEKLAVPADMIRATFGAAFDVDDEGNVYAKDKTGAKMLSRRKPGDIATFDEALELLVSDYPGKNAILKGHGGSGSGANGGGGGGDAKTKTRAEFDAMDQVARSKFFQDGGKVVDAAA